MHCDTTERLLKVADKIVTIPEVFFFLEAFVFYLFSTLLSYVYVLLLYKYYYQQVKVAIFRFLPLQVDMSLNSDTLF
jgi:hypothetical protein